MGTRHLALVLHKPWVSAWKTIGTLLAQNLEVMATITDSHLSSLAQEEICLHTDARQHIPVQRIKAPLGLFGTASGT